MSMDGRDNISSSAISTLSQSIVVVLGQCTGSGRRSVKRCTDTARDAGSRAMHMYRMYGSRVTQERLPRSYCREDMDDFNKPNISGLDYSFPIYQNILFRGYITLMMLFAQALMVCKVKNPVADHNLYHA